MRSSTADGRSRDSRLSQLSAQLVGTLLLLVGVSTLFWAGVSPRRLPILFVFVVVELLVVVLCLLAAAIQFGRAQIRTIIFGAFASGSHEAAEAASTSLQSALREPSGLSVKILIDAIAVLTAASVAYITAVSGGFNASPFPQFVLIVIIFGQATSPTKSSAIPLAFALGTSIFVTLYALQSHVSAPSNLRIASWLYLACGLASLAFATALLWVQERIRGLTSQDERPPR